ncbi:MAG: lipopolysaccharide biosynthesis protein [Terriglobales bacterium]
MEPAAGAGLRRAAVRGAGATIFAAGISFVLQLGAMVVLARLLTPADFGVVAMVTTFSLLLESFGLAGFTEAILQREDVTHSLASNLLWINVAVVALLAAGLAGAGSLLAGFYHDPFVRGVAEGMAGVVVINGMATVPLALLERGMRFGTVSTIGVAARAAQAAVSIALALAGWGFWALVAGYFAHRITRASGALGACRWLPKLPGRAPGTGESLAFGLRIYGRYAMGYAANNTDNLLVGWRFSASALGFYKKAYDIFVLPANQLTAPIWSVVITTLSRVRRDMAQYRRYLLGATGAVAFAGMGIAADFTLVGRDLVRFLLGSQWAEAGRIFQLFGPGIGVMLLYGATGWIHVSIGRADRWLRWGVVELLLTTGLFVAALPLGPRGIAGAWTAAYFILVIPGFWYAGKPIDLGAGTVVNTVWRYFAAAAVAGAAAYGITAELGLFAGATGAAGALERAVWGTVVFAALYAGGVTLLHGGLAPFRQLRSLAADLRPTPQGGAAGEPGAGSAAGCLE